MAFNSRGAQALRARIARAMEGAATAATGYAYDALNTAGSGVHYPGNPNPSSRPGEYPATQSHALRDSIDKRRLSSLTWSVGAINNPPAWAAYLEFRPVSEQTPGSGPRAWATKLLHDPQLHTAILEGLRGAS
ncbi:hypothetical protein [Deinococcus peraridilitoris]|uniref:HK97 gp10 family phage protein n=1 Tax=Deinococcus peraridilitoris (strain DSM 19664 / LMG 22246 / CIP 109416 / KR-200) TaxID=937777 RepID=L0A3I8_DEIPD|nr:hypothetical protein [Deinococcus peraridilitoris]AFZ67570.1 hypothetical protein Deipe_2074 [Deinococcus peraridilitoris DSM 19664]